MLVLCVRTINRHACDDDIQWIGVFGDSHRSVKCGPFIYLYIYSKPSDTLNIIHNNGPVLCPWLQSIYRLYKTLHISTRCELCVCYTFFQCHARLANEKHICDGHTQPHIKCKQIFFGCLVYAVFAHRKHVLGVFLM